MENAVFIISHLIMLLCAVLIFYNSAEAKTSVFKAKRKAINPAKTSVGKIEGEEFASEIELTPSLLQA